MPGLPGRVWRRSIHRKIGIPALIRLKIVNIFKFPDFSDFFLKVWVPTSTL
jgi:hypothetical protein